MTNLLDRRGFFLASLGLTAGCAEFSSRNPYWTTVRQLGRGLGGESREVTALMRERAAEIPYASLLVRTSQGSTALFVLQSFNPDGTLDWAGAAKQLITTYGAFVTRLVGLEIDLLATSIGGDWKQDLRQMIGKQATRQVRFKADRLVDVELKSRFSSAGRSVMPVAGLSMDLLEIKERVSAQGREQLTNRYWVDPRDGFCWLSEQRPIPTLPEIRFEVMKRPSQSA